MGRSENINKTIYRGQKEMKSKIKELSAEVERLKNFEYEKCNICNGDGIIDEHDPNDPHTDGCTTCPIQVQCPNCEAKGFVPKGSQIKEPQTDEENNLPF